MPAKIYKNTSAEVFFLQKSTSVEVISGVNVTFVEVTVSC